MIHCTASWCLKAELHGAAIRCDQTYLINLTHQTCPEPFFLLADLMLPATLSCGCGLLTPSMPLCVRWWALLSFPPFLTEDGGMVEDENRVIARTSFRLRPNQSSEISYFFRVIFFLLLWVLQLLNHSTLSAPLVLLSAWLGITFPSSLSLPDFLFACQPRRSRSFPLHDSKYVLELCTF